jgi:hypothetical protein
MSVGKKGDRSLGGCSAIGNEGALLIEESLPTSAPWLSVGRREMPSRLPLSVGIGSVDGLSRSIRMVAGGSKSDRIGSRNPASDSHARCSCWPKNNSER